MQYQLLPLCITHLVCFKGTCLCHTSAPPCPPFVQANFSFVVEWPGFMAHNEPMNLPNFCSYLSVGFKVFNVFWLSLNGFTTYSQVLNVSLISPHVIPYSLPWVLFLEPIYCRSTALTVPTRVHWIINEFQVFHFDIWYILKYVIIFFSLELVVRNPKS
jgi:hypothetical protein